MRAAWHTFPARAAQILDKAVVREKIFLTLFLTLAAAVFIIDTLLPAEYSTGFLYIPLTVLGFWVRHTRIVALTGIVLTALMVIGYIISPSSAGYGSLSSLLHRGTAISLLWWIILLTLARQQAKSALEASKERLREIGGFARLGWIDFGAEDCTQTFLHKEALDTLGIAPRDHLRAWEEVLEHYIHPNDRLRVKQTLETACQEHQAFELEFRVARSDGTLKWIRCRGEPIQAEGASRILATLIDITELRAAEEASYQSQARLHSILETAPEAIVTIDERGAIEAFSRSAEVLFGYKAEEIIGQNISTLMPSPDREQHDEYIAHYLKTSERRIIGIGRLVTGLRRDGTTFPMELSVGELSIGGHRVFTGFIRDMTSRQRIEQELQQAQKMEAVGQLTGGIAHDFNNLLTVIIGNLEMLEVSSRLRAKDRALLSETQEAALQGAKLTEHLLAFGRRQPLHPAVFDVGELVSDFTNLLRRSLGGAIEMRTTIRGEHHTVFVDETQLQNALLNLALNARDAMPQGGSLTIDISRTDVDIGYVQSHPELQSGQFVLLSVTDTGTGMTPEVRLKAFEPFFTTKPAGAGSGLGLSMVYGFVKQSGGQIQLFSEPGQGTTIRILLPLVAEARRATDHPAPQLEAFSARGETVLVVEDDRRVRHVTVARLRAIGYTVIEAENAPEALEELEANPSADLLFTDIMMPGGMTGMELAQHVRMKHPNIHILLTSGYAEPNLLEQELSEGTAWLRKPYTAVDLARRIRDLLDDQRVHH